MTKKLLVAVGLTLIARRPGFEQKRRADFVRRHAAKKIGELKAQ